MSTDNINQITKGFDLNDLADIARFSAYSATQGAAQAGLETVVRGGSFTDNLKQAMTTQAGNLGMAIGFNLIGDWALGKYSDGSPQKVMAHAFMGGLIAEATGSDFKTGALAAGANEALSDSLSNLVGGDENLELMSSQIVGLLAAAAVNGDLEKGSEIAKYATAYNQQVHREAKQRLERGLEALHTQGKYQNLDAETVLHDLRKIADGNIASASDLNPDVVKFLNAEFTPAGLRDTLFEPEAWESYLSIAIDFLFPTPAGKAAAVQKISGKISKETLQALEIKFGAESLAGAKGVGGGSKFADQAKLDDHFARHGSDFGAKNALEYQAQADRFLTVSKPMGVLEKVRPNGDVVRYNPATDEFGVISSGGSIRTYYKPDPAVHGKGSNLDYFNAQ